MKKMLGKLKTGSQDQLRQSFYFTSGFAMPMSISAVFSEYGKLIHTILQDVQLFFFQNSGAFITFNLSETLVGRLLGERRLLEEIRYS